MAEVMEYKCPSCNGAIEFDISSQKMKCPYCRTEFEVATLLEYEKSKQKDASDHLNWDKMDTHTWTPDEENQVRAYHCNSCGGEIIGLETTAADSCPYCGNPVIMEQQLSGDLRPDFIIPFKKDKEFAKKSLSDHIKSKRLVPKAFIGGNRIEEIKGIYVPFWLFDADVDADFRYRATEMMTWSDADYIYTKTDFFAVLLSGKVSFEKVPVDGSERMADDLMESIEPYDFREAIPFETPYLSGYLADRYDVTEEESIDRANDRVRSSTSEEFRSQVAGYASVVEEGASIRLDNGKANYALYPVWLFHTKWNDRDFTFAMNGQTGKFVGDLPIDKGAAVKWFFSIFMIVGTVIMFVLLLLSKI